ncbi:MAG TPA: hypothetical protein PLI79_05415 [Mycobacterium sp.]|nr:hypothetical protein [Mycobacterium sp.]
MTVLGTTAVGGAVTVTVFVTSTVEVSVVAATGFDPPQPARANAAQVITAAFLCIAAA